MWFHVDGAYGAAAMLVPEARGLFSGIEAADSVVVDPHKWLFAPYDCGAVIYRSPDIARQFHTQQACVLDSLRTCETDWNPSDLAFHYSRRARGLPFWFSLAVHGTEAYADAIRAGLATAKAVARRIRDTSGLELVREPELGIVLFRRLGWSPADYDEWSKRLLADGVAFVSPSTWEGETVGRLIFLNPNTTAEISYQILQTMMD
jgi:glutamate/tyrosine decarboxylase-like PLP-dependent enzyme